MQKPVWRIEVSLLPHIFDPLGASIHKDIRDLGIKDVEWVRCIRVYFLIGELTEEQINKIAKLLLSDPITEKFVIGKPKEGSPPKDTKIIEVAYNPGVCEPVEDSVKLAIRELGIDTIDAVKTATKYIIKGKLSEQQTQYICRKLLVNPVIQYIILKDVPLSLSAEAYKFQLQKVDILSANEQQLQELSHKYMLSLSLQELKAIQNYFLSLSRQPTDVELETIAQTWSEHCYHKTFKGLIEYEGRLIDGLLATFIMAATQELSKPWCISTFVDNAGVIEFDDEFGVCFKVETHNHPSAIEPYGGANTGIGGVIRDPLGTGLGAKPILNTDVFCFGPLDYPHEKLPKGTLHPKYVMEGVVAGVRDYGNRMGIPTANGAVLFDEGYLCNPLVFCGTVGILPKDKCKKAVKPGDLIVLVGGKTGRDGIHGATFSSALLDEDSEVKAAAAVQIGNAIVEKKLLDVLLRARDLNLYNAITDCGGGGLSSAVGELGKDCGVRCYLQRVPLKYQGLSYCEIWLSESQERMILSVPKDNYHKLQEIFREEDVELTIIGEFTDSKTLELFYDNVKVCELSMDFLHKGIPKPKLKARWQPKSYEEANFLDEPPEKDLTQTLLQILSLPNIASKEWIIRQYDHEVQAQTMIKPLVGKTNDAPSDACVIKPLPNSNKGIAVACGINPRYGLIDTYWMAASSIEEALRNLVCVGADPDRIAILDNFCWGNPEVPENLGALVRCCQACYEFAKAYEVPFISGKDSLYNEYKVGDKTISIPHSLLISGIGLIEDVSRCISMDVKRAGNLIYIVGNTYIEELGGSHYFLFKGFIGNQVPKVRAAVGKRILKAIHQAISSGLICSCHDCSEGGVAVALSEMAFGGGYGLNIQLSYMPTITENITQEERPEFILFSESNSRFLIEVSPRKQTELEKLLSLYNVPYACIGEVVEEPSLRIYYNSNIVIEADISELKAAWQSISRLFQ